MAMPFTKMHGLGNDFVVVDARAAPFAPEAARVRRIADRRRGIGCDQLIVVGPGAEGEAAAMRVFNADGSPAETCGNGARCVGLLLLDEGAAEGVRFGTPAGPVEARPDGPGRVSVDLPPPRFGWRDIPLAEERDTLDLGLRCGPLAGGTAVSVGNPHAVFLVADADAVDLAGAGPRVERDPLFPERTNVEVVAVEAPDRLRMRVWERGAGITEACGSGACAAVVAAARLGRAGREATVVLDGGELGVAWLGDGRLRLAGEAAASFRGELPAGAA